MFVANFNGICRSTAPESTNPVNTAAAMRTLRFAVPGNYRNMGRQNISNIFKLNNDTSFHFVEKSVERLLVRISKKYEFFFHTFDIPLYFLDQVCLM